MWWPCTYTLRWVLTKGTFYSRKILMGLALPGLQCQSTAGVLPVLPAPEHGGPAYLRRFREAPALRQEDPQPRCARRPAPDAPEPPEDPQAQLGRRSGQLLSIATAHAREEVRRGHCSIRILIYCIVFNLISELLCIIIMSPAPDPDVPSSVSLVVFFVFSICSAHC